MERVVVLGSDGPAGAALVGYLRDRAFWVRTVDPPGRTGHARANEQVALDLTDRAQAARAVAGVGHVYALDLALPRTRPSGCPPGALGTEVAMLANVLSAAPASGVNRVLYALPGHDQPPWRDMPALAAPLLADAERAGVEVRSGLLANVYGSAGAPDGASAASSSWVEELVRAAAGLPGRSVTDVGPDAAVPLCYAHDCAVALYLLMRSNHRRPLLLAHPCRHRPGEIAAELSRLSLRPVLVDEAGPGVAFRPPADTDADLRRALAWTPPTDLRSGLALLLEGSSVVVSGGAR